MDSLDIVAVRIKGQGGVLNLYNIYNPCDHHNTLHRFRLHLHQREERENQVEVHCNAQDGDIWLGDFNRHHPMWDKAEDHRLFTPSNLEAAQILLNMLADYGMEMALPAGVPTLLNSAKNETRPDNVFCTDAIANNIISCQVLPEERPAMADHYPIVTKVQLPVTVQEQIPPRDFHDVDWDEFKAHLHMELNKIPEPGPLNSAEEIEKALDDLEQSLVTTIERLVPRKKPTPYSKRWWTRDLSKARAEYRRLDAQSRKWWNAPFHPAHEEARVARNYYTNLLKQTRKAHWEDWIASISTTNLWDANKYIGRTPTDTGKTRIPTLKTVDANGGTWEHVTNEEKSRTLHKTFFYEPPTPKNLSADTIYPGPKFKMEQISDGLIMKTARKLKPYKAPGMNEIPNVVLTRCIQEIVPYLGHIYRATFTAKHYPERWKRYKTAVLRKPGRPDYSSPNAYRPIALLDTMAKLLSACVKEILEYQVAKHHMLPANQFGGQPGCTTTDSIHLLTDFIKRAWRRHEEVVVLFLDIQAAFPNTGVEMLIHELRMHGVPKNLANWIARKMDGRETVLTFDDYTSKPIPVRSGLDQGCNLSVLLFAFYSSKQISSHPNGKTELKTAFVDDTAAATSAPTCAQAAEKMQTVLNRPNGLLDWAKDHDCKYTFAKFQGLACTTRRVPDPQNPRRRIKPAPVKIKITDTHTVETSTACKFLGVIIDSELRFKEQANQAVAKGAQWVGQIRRLSKMAKGAQGAMIRRLYRAVAVPRMLYAADVWCVPYKRAKKGRKPRQDMVAAIRKMETIQRRVAIQITGALRTTPSNLLYAHADLLPVRETITLQCQAAALRMATLPPHHPLSKTVKTASKKPSFKHATPLDNVMALAELRGKQMETIDPRKKHYSWKPPFKITIPKTAEEAEEAEEADESDIRIYTDGSGYKGHAGAAAVLYRNIRRPRVARHHLGTLDDHTVFSGEAVGQLLALLLLTTETGSLGHSKVLVAVDNQASLSRHEMRKRGTRDDVYDEIYRLAENLKTRHYGLEITLRWIPSHTGRIAGNDRADVEAKLAAEDPSSGKNNNTKILKKALPTSKAAWRQTLRNKVIEEYRSNFRKHPRYAKASKIDSSVPSAKFRRLTEGMTRQQASLLIQLRTSHIALRAYLHRFKLADDPLCPECHTEPETVMHVLKFCPAYKEQRLHLQRDLGRDIEIDIDLLSDRKRVKKVLEYLEATGRFMETHGAVGEPAPVAREEDNIEGNARLQAEDPESWI